MSKSEKGILHDILNSSKIYEYDVTVCKYEELNLRCGVGSKLDNGICHGTLGCFATRQFENKGSELCALLSGHVAKILIQSEHIVISGEKVRTKDVRFLICEDENCNADIAALVLNKLFQCGFTFDCEFKTRNDKVKKCQMPKWENSSLKPPFEVFLRGASTPFGRGIVSSTDMSQNEIDNCILTETIDESIPFAEPGDSGAIVCCLKSNETNYEQTIITLAVLRGRYTSKQDQQLVGYLCVKLDFALDHLAQKTKGNFRLCSESQLCS